MRKIISLLVVLVTAFAMINLTSTSQAENSIALGSTGLDVAFGGRGPSYPIPTTASTAYGLYKPNSSNIFIFDNSYFSPSTVVQTVDVPVTDPQAAIIASALEQGFPPTGYVFMLCYWFPPGDPENSNDTLNGGCYYSDATHAQVPIPTGAKIDFFRLEFQPFSIEDLGNGYYRPSVISYKITVFGHFGPTPTLTPSPTPTPVVKAHKVVIFVQGYASCLTKGQETGPSCDPNGANPFEPIKQELRNVGFTNSDFIEFSYTNNHVDKNGNWVTKDYGCTDVTNQSYKQPAKDLLDTIKDYKKAHPNYQIYVIGHSFGGLVAFQALGQEIDRRGLNDRSPLPIAGLVTIDSPLNGIRRDWLREFADNLINKLPDSVVPKCFKLFFNSKSTDGVVKLFEGERALQNNESAALQQNSVVKELAQKAGTVVWNTGNSKDCFWSPSSCSPYDSSIDPAGVVSSGRLDYPKTQIVGNTSNQLLDIQPDCKTARPVKNCSAKDLAWTHNAFLLWAGVSPARRQIAEFVIGNQVK